MYSCKCVYSDIQFIFDKNMLRQMKWNILAIVALWVLYRDAADRAAAREASSASCGACKSSNSEITNLSC